MGGQAHLQPGQDRAGQQEWGAKPTDHTQARRLTRAHTFPGSPAHTLSQELIQSSPALERREPARSLCPACVWL